MTDPVGDIYAAVERQRAALIRMERGAATEMVQAYGRIWRRIDEQVRRLVRRYEKEKTTDPEAQLPLARLNELQSQVEAELRRFHSAATKSVLRTEQKAVEAAQRDFRELIALEGDAGVVAAWNRLPVSAVESMVGFTASGSPLRALFDAYGPDVSERIRQELIAGLALGQGPRTIARRVRGVMGGDLARALRISRTETARSYREATHLNYQANSHIIDGWRWVSAKGPRTCAACLALDGTWHPVSERQADHPNGRCAQIPSVKGRDSADSEPSWETGAQWLAKQTPEVQAQVLGKAGQKAYAAGAVKLEDLRGDAYSPVWGHTPRVRPLAQVVGPEEAQRWAEEAEGRESSPVTSAQNETPGGSGFTPFVSRDDANEWATRAFTEANHSVTRAEQAAIDRYTGPTEYHRWNHALRHSGGPPPDLEAQTRLLDGVLDRSRTPQNVVTYRGTRSGYPTDYQELQKMIGLEVEDRAYLSTSLDQFKAFDFLGPDCPLVEMHIPRGTRVGYLNPGESEMILPRGTRMKIIGTRLDMDDPDNPLKVLIMEVIDG